jgi:hypothetical protein
MKLHPSFDTVNASHLRMLVMLCARKQTLYFSTPPGVEFQKRGPLFAIFLLYEEQLAYFECQGDAHRYKRHV